MSDKLKVENSIAIHASKEVVWDALVNPAQTKKYMFGCETISDWNVGSSLLWQGHYEGKDMVFVKGYILDIHPNQLLKYSVIDPNSKWEDIPENYLKVTYTLA